MLPKIDIYIPFEPGEFLGSEYNRILKRTANDWALLVDHDVFLSCNPHWYFICQKVIEKCDPDVGMFVCYGSKLGNTEQMIEGAPSNFKPIPEHQAFAKQLFEKYQYSTTQIEKGTGMFMLIREWAWHDVRGFSKNIGMFGVTKKFNQQLKKRGWKVMRINGLYVYHLRERREESWIEGENVTQDYAKKKLEK